MCICVYIYTYIYIYIYIYYTSTHVHTHISQYNLIISSTLTPLCWLTICSMAVQKASLKRAACRKFQFAALSVWFDTL